MKTIVKVPGTTVVLSAVAAGMLHACVSVPPASTAYVSVYKSMGSVQCKAGGTSLSAMLRQLSDAGIAVRDASCGTDGRMRVAVCGAADGRIGIFNVAEARLPAATAMGFAPLDSLPGASSVVCPPAP